jgi:hypothetical protein
MIGPKRLALGAMNGRTSRWRTFQCVGQEMPTFEEVLRAARRLPEADRRRLVEELGGGGEIAPDERRRAALERWRARAGTGHSDFSDVSENKNKHLADIYATKP